jgi:hypothetical protein
MLANPMVAAPVSWMDQNELEGIGGTLTELKVNKGWQLISL